MARQAQIKQWPSAFSLRDGTPVEYAGKTLSGRHRVRFLRTSSPTIREAQGIPRQLSPDGDWSIVYTLDGSGICRCDGTEGPFDYVSARPA